MTRVTARSDEFPLDVDLMSVGQLERRGRLTTAVVEMLAEMPSDRIQMKDVSERSGVALGTLYRYFPTKQQLLAAAMTAWSGLESVRRPEKLRADGGENNAYERVLALHRREMKAFERRPYFARLEIELHSSSDQFVIESLDLRAAAHRRMLFELMDGVPAETARVAAVAIGGTMLTALALWTSGRIGFVEAQRNVEDVIGLVIR
ncbi:TetR family transcriptional regulator [Rhodococcus qingshengii]|uniref:TetR/AcrR family transcriptional regulator n=1 Tax=Rhodococcus qingshengii TaxID=334542 RepID=UPI0021124017|nr:TetR/AcrR family transcriptional regulator [Rhodococcus qingshengii]UUE24055.1 TetR family transcriptional regulator [Rhodococcus qingshengii]